VVVEDAHAVAVVILPVYLCVCLLGELIPNGTYQIPTCVFLSFFLFVVRIRDKVVVNPSQETLMTMNLSLGVIILLLVIADYPLLFLHRKIHNVPCTETIRNKYINKKMMID